MHEDRPSLLAAFRGFFSSPASVTWRTKTFFVFFSPLLTAGWFTRSPRYATKFVRRNGWEEEEQRRLDVVVLSLSSSPIPSSSARCVSVTHAKKEPIPIIFRQPLDARGALSYRGVVMGPRASRLATADDGTHDDSRFALFRVFHIRFFFRIRRGQR